MCGLLVSLESAEADQVDAATGVEHSLLQAATLFASRSRAVFNHKFSALQVAHIYHLFYTMPQGIIQTHP